MTANAWPMLIVILLCVAHLIELGLGGRRKKYHQFRLLCSSGGGSHGESEGEEEGGREEEGEREEK